MIQPRPERAVRKMGGDDDEDDDDQQRPLAPGLRLQRSASRTNGESIVIEVEPG